MIYRTKGDCWGPVVTTMILPAAGLVCLVLGEAGLGWALLTVGLLVGLIFATILFMWGWPVEYDPGASGADGEPILLVRCGRLVRYKIPLAEIREVRPSAELLSSPASCSYDRIKVVYGVYRSLLISPRDRDRFLDELVSRANHLERDGDSLVRKDRARAPVEVGHPQRRPHVEHGRIGVADRRGEGHRDHRGADRPERCQRAAAQTGASGAGGCAHKAGNGNWIRQSGACAVAGLSAFLTSWITTLS